MFKHSSNTIMHNPPFWQWRW